MYNNNSFSEAEVEVFTEQQLREMKSSITKAVENEIARQVSLIKTSSPGHPQNKNNKCIF